jgi:energy-coupling factor transporter ATP-binding protein EcfA2
VEADFMDIFDGGIEPEKLIELDPGLDQEPKDLLDYKLGKSPPREWVIEDWIPKGEISSLYAPGGAGKSTLFLQMGVAVASGGSFLGLTIPKAMPVLEIVCEDNDDEVWRRLDAIRQSPEYEFHTEIKRGVMKVWVRTGFATAIAKEMKDDVVKGEFFDCMCRYVRKMVESLPNWRDGFLLKFDTVSDAYYGSEIIKDRVNKFVKVFCGHFNRKYGATVVLSAHPSKSGMSTGDMSSGNVAWNNAVRNRLIMHRIQEGDIPHLTRRQVDRLRLAGVITLERFKCNYGKAFERIFIEWIQGRFVKSPLVADLMQAEEGCGIQFCNALDDALEDNPENHGDKRVISLLDCLRFIYMEDGQRLKEDYENLGDVMGLLEGKNLEAAKRWFQRQSESDESWKVADQGKQYELEKLGGRWYFSRRNI